MNAYKLFDLTGKVAIVTGGAGYLGQAISEGLAEAGAYVYIVSSNDKKCEQLVKELSKKDIKNCKAGYINIQDKSTIKDCFSKIMQESGRVDVLVNNASFGAVGDVESMTEADWVKGLDGTINGVFRCTKAVLPIMTAQKGGSIINLSSMYGIVSPNPEIYGDSGFNNPPNYGAGKAAINQFTRYMACHYGKYDIRVNSVSPGPFPNEDVQKNTLFINQLKSKNPLRRIGKPADLKGVIVFLASSASSYTTGQNICIDGGWTAW